MRRTPVYDPYDDDAEPQRLPPPKIRRISTTPGAERGARSGNVRPLNTVRRAPPRGPDPRVWFVRGALGVAALAGLWLGLQALFPLSETQVTQEAPPTLAIDSSAVGAPEPPAAAARAAQVAPPVQAAPPVAQPTAAPEGDRLPGLPTPAPAAQQQAAQPAAPAPAAAQAQPQTPAQAPQPPTDPAARPTIAPIPPAGSQASAPTASQPAPQAPAPAAKPQPAPPPPAATGSGPFELAASASPANPVSSQANVTITVRATQNGTPLAGVSCMATVYYRTATARQPEGGFRTNANGAGSFVLDARGTTFGYYVPVDVTCTGRGGTVTARTGFTPVQGR